MAFTVVERKNVEVYLQNVHSVYGSTCVTHSVHFFGGLFGIVCVDTGESDVFFFCAYFVTHFSLNVEADHQLVDDHSNEGADEWGKNRHQEPTISNPKE